MHFLVPKLAFFPEKQQNGGKTRIEPQTQESTNCSVTQIKKHYKNCSEIDEDKQRPYQWDSLMVR